MMLMPSTNYKLFYLVIVSVKYLHETFINLEKNIKIKNRKPNQTKTL